MLLRCLYRITTLTAFVVCGLGIQAPQRHSKSTSLLSRVRSAGAGESASRNDTGTHFDVHGSEASRPPSCIRNTGVSCIAEGCDAGHGEQKCSYGKCWCNAGCSDAAGGCHHEANVLVASGFVLKNVKWPLYYMVASSLDNELHVTDSKSEPLAKFNLYRLPGQGDNPQDFLLVPEASLSYSIAVVHRYHCDQLMDSSQSDAEQNINMTGKGHRSKIEKDITGQPCEHTWKAETQSMTPGYGTNPSVQDAGVRFWQAPITDKSRLHTEHGAITIRGTGEHVNKFMFVHDGSWDVSTRGDDPGLGGYWIPEPPLPFTFPMYDGPPCRINCDESLSVRSAFAGGSLLLSFAVAFLS